MIERIDLFMPPRSRYHVLQHFTKSLAAALNRTGVRCRILEAERENPKAFIDTILEDPPECTLSFNGLLPDEEGRFFSDLIGIPHVACLVDSPQQFVSLTLSPLTIVTTVDRFASDFFQGLNFSRALFMPHGVDKDLIVAPTVNDQRPIDVLMLASYIDFEATEKKWKKTPLGKVWEEASEEILSNRDISAAQAIAEAIDRNIKSLKNFDPHKIDFLLIMDQIEEYVNGKDRIALLKAIKGTKVHLIGAGSEKWKQFLDKSNDVVIQPPVEYQESLELMRKSKIVLNSRPAFKNGAHERIFAGIACGAAVITNENIYMQENFKNRESILFYRYKHWDEANDLIKEYLSDEDKRMKLVLKGQKIVKEGHTWDHRAATLISELGPILEKISTEKT